MTVACAVTASEAVSFWSARGGCRVLTPFSLIPPSPSPTLPERGEAHKGRVFGVRGCLPHPDAFLPLIPLPLSS